MYELTDGLTWKHVDNKYDITFDIRPEVIIYKDGAKFYMIV
ncbi:hypothetical protein GCM10008915_25990 [Bifidobacterium pullorum subsp. gallinarum]